MEVCDVRGFDAGKIATHTHALRAREQYSLIGT